MPLVIYETNGLQNRTRQMEKKEHGGEKINTTFVKIEKNLCTLRHTDGCSQSWLVAGLCHRWTSRRQRHEEQRTTLMWELGS